jgi:hypothetical protein
MYVEWNSLALFALIRNDGIVVRNLIRAVEEFIEEEVLFIVEMSGFGWVSNGVLPNPILSNYHPNFKKQI